VKDMVDIKDRILSLRTENSLTQEKMAKIFNVGLSTISMWERGERVPRPKVLQEICDFFNVDMDYLMGRSDIKNKYQAGVKYDWEDNLQQTHAKSQGSDILTFYRADVKGLTEDEKEELKKDLEKYTDFLLQKIKEKNKK
jgi:transcriptional regulator